MKLTSVVYNFDLVGPGRVSITMEKLGGDGNGGMVWGYVIVAPMGYLEEGVGFGNYTGRPSESVAEMLIEKAFLAFREDKKNEKQ